MAIHHIWLFKTFLPNSVYNAVFLGRPQFATPRWRGNIYSDVSIREKLFLFFQIRGGIVVKTTAKMICRERIDSYADYVPYIAAQTSRSSAQQQVFVLMIMHKDGDTKVFSLLLVPILVTFSLCFLHPEVFTFDPKYLLSGLIYLHLDSSFDENQTEHYSAPSRS